MHHKKRELNIHLSLSPNRYSINRWRIIVGCSDRWWICTEGLMLTLHLMKQQCACGQTPIHQRHLRQQEPPKQYDSVHWPLSFPTLMQNSEPALSYGGDNDWQLPPWQGSVAELTTLLKGKGLTPDQWQPPYIASQYKFQSTVPLTSHNTVNHCPADLYTPITMRLCTVGQTPHTPGIH